MSTNKEVLVSAVIITYKRPIEILKRAVVSALNQTYRKMEVIVVNDCPEDQSLVENIRKMLEELGDDRVKYVVHQKNSGACKARNTGILAAKGEIIALLDDDDEWLPEKIEFQLEGFSTEKIGMVYSPFYNITDSLPGELAVRGTKSGKLAQELLWTNCIGGSSMSIIRREVFDKVGLFDENLLSSQDYDMWLRIAQEYDIQCVNKPLTRRFLLEESITKNFEKQKQGFYLFSEKHIELYKKNPQAYNYRLNRRVNKWIEQGHFKDAWKLYCIAIRVKPFSKYNVLEPCKGLVKFFM